MHQQSAVVDAELFTNLKENIQPRKQGVLSILDFAVTTWN